MAFVRLNLFRDIVGLMRKNEEYLAVLVNCDTAKLFTLPFFKKQKESTWVLVLKKSFIFVE